MHPTRALRRLITVLAAVAVLAAACGDDDGGDAADPTTTSTTSAAAETTSTTTTEPGTTAPLPEDAETLADLQVVFVEFGDEGFVTIENRGDGDADVNGVFLCQRPNYADLGNLVDGGVIPAGESVDVPAENWGGLTADAGEAALYEGNDFGSADAILSYVQWGAGIDGRAGVAASAGLWPDATSTVGVDPNFNSIELGGFGGDPENWS